MLWDALIVKLISFNLNLCITPSKKSNLKPRERSCLKFWIRTNQRHGKHPMFNLNQETVYISVDRRAEERELNHKKQREANGVRFNRARKGELSLIKAPTINSLPFTRFHSHRSYYCYQFTFVVALASLIDLITLKWFNVCKL